MKKKTKNFLVCSGTIIALLLCQFVYHSIITNNQRSTYIRQYPGECVYVHNECMQTYDVGVGEKVYVLLPDYKTIAPIIDYMPMIDDMAKTNRVIAIEPFGYGASDISERERSIENIVEEIHSVVLNLGVDNYTLIAHGYAYLYALYYVDRYNTEVDSIVGLDPVLPTYEQTYDLKKVSEVNNILNTLGFYRTFVTIQPSLFQPLTLWTDYAYSASQNQMILDLAKWNSVNDNLVDEGKHSSSTYARASKVVLPTDFPIYFITSSETERRYDWWESTHSEYLANFENSKQAKLNAGHSLHWKAYRHVVYQIEKWFRPNEAE